MKRNRLEDIGINFIIMLQWMFKMEGVDWINLSEDWVKGLCLMDMVIYLLVL